MAYKNQNTVKTKTLLMTAQEILDNYDYKTSRVSRLRGGFLCETADGPVLLKPTQEKDERIKVRARVLNELAGKGFLVDCILPDKEGKYCVSMGEGEERYILTKWFSGQECDTKDFSQVCTALRTLARLHNALDDISCHADEEIQIARNLLKEYDKHDRELKKIRNYLTSKKNKNDFELLAASNCQGFIEEGEQAGIILKSAGYEDVFEKTVAERGLSHGDFTYHSIYVNSGVGAVCGFECMRVDIKLNDLYYFMRKMMEKYNWDVKLGYLMFCEYDAVRTLSKQDIRLIGGMFAYPEKFWKIINYYYNNSKAWIPAKSLEKLKLVTAQNRMRREFIRTLTE